VLDISCTEVATSKKRLGENAGAVKLIESDFTAYYSDQYFALWYDRAVSRFFKVVDDLRNNESSLRNALRIGERLIVASFAISGPEKCSGLPVV